MCDHVIHMCMTLYFKTTRSCINMLIYLLLYIYICIQKIFLRFTRYIELPKCPMEKTQCPGIRCVILLQTFYENWLKNDDFIVILVFFRIVSTVCGNMPKHDDRVPITMPTTCIDI